MALVSVRTDVKDSCVIALGSINVDFQVAAQRWPNPGETLMVERFLMHGGGKAANVAYLARRFGVDSMLIGCVGSDLLRQEALRPLEAARGDTSNVKLAKDQQTGVALIVVPPDGNKVIFVAGNANEAWPVDDGDEVANAIARAQKNSTLVVDLEVPVNIVRQAVVAARAKGIKVILDPSPAERMTEDLYPSVDFITPNESEAWALTGIRVRSVEDAYKAGKVLVDRGTGAALVKLGAQGCTLVDRMRSSHIRGFPMRAIDTMGAGDAFAGALAVALLDGQSVEDAGRYAVAASALTVTRFGSQPACPTRAEVEDLLSRSSKA